MKSYIDATEVPTSFKGLEARVLLVWKH